MFINIKKNIKNIKILVIGDCLLDAYFFGNCERISPESPTPVIVYDNEKYELGGAGNVASNLAALGAEVYLSSVIAQDSMHDIVNGLLKKKKININLSIKSKSIKTIVKKRIIAKNQQIVRLDYEKYDEKKYAPLRKKILIKLINKIKFMDTIIISDYGKAFLDERFIQKIIISAKKLGKTVIIDPRKRNTNYNSFKKADYLTPNLYELRVLKNDLKNESNEIKKLSKHIIKKYNIKNLIVTRSEKGLMFISKNKVIKSHSKAKQVFDVSGAGDTVVSVIAVCLVLKIEMKTILEIANVCASWVISFVGTKSIDRDFFLENLNKRIKNV